MATAVDSMLKNVARTAKDRVAIDLGCNSGAPLLDYCHDLVDWVVYGQRKPIGSPTERVRIAVRAAVKVGLREVYGLTDSPRIDSKIFIRLESL